MQHTMLRGIMLHGSLLFSKEHVEREGECVRLISGEPHANPLNCVCVNNLKLSPWSICTSCALELALDSLGNPLFLIELSCMKSIRSSPRRLTDDACGSQVHACLGIRLFQRFRCGKCNPALVLHFFSGRASSVDFDLNRSATECWG